MEIAPTDLRVVFSQWRPWSNGEKLIEYNSAGIYALARLDIPPVGPADPLDERVIYIGETCDQTLGIRLNQFDRSAFREKPGHSGGWTYRAKFTDGHASLHFAMFVAPELELKTVFIRYIERMLIWKYAERWGRLPYCNSK